MKLILFIACLMIPVARANDRLVNCRFLCLEGDTILLASGQKNEPQTIKLSLKSLSKPIALQASNGAITFNKQEAADTPVATAQVQENIKDAIIVFIPAEKGGLTYETVVLDSSASAFPTGSSLVLNVCPQLVKFTIGGHDTELQRNESATLGLPKEVNDFNMATVKCQYQETGNWRSAFESSVRLLKTQHNLFVAYTSQASKRPRLWTHQE